MFSLFERLLTGGDVLKRPWLCFALGLSFSLFAMVIALFVFPKDPALVTVAVSSLLLVPVLREELVAQRVSVLKSKGVIDVLRSQWSFFLSYFWIFIGMFFTFSFFSIMLPSVASSKLFETQLAFIGGAFSPDVLTHLLVNNTVVLVSFVLFSLIAGSGSIFLLAWNASVWGAVFGAVARSSAESIQGSAWILYALVLVSVLPHTIIEMSSYIVGIIAGSLVSESIVLDGLKSVNFDSMVKKAGILFLVAFLLVILGGIVETAVLDNVAVYKMVLAFM